jgi:hypothetical protein
MKNILIIVLVFLLPVPSLAAVVGYTEDPLKIGIGARAMGMGGVCAGVCDGASNMFNNPAGIASQGMRLSSMYTSLLGDVSYTVVGGNWPVKAWFLNGGVGIGAALSGVSRIITPSQSGFSYFDYHNNVYLLSYGQKVKLNKYGFDAGLRLKLFDEGFTGSQSYAGSGYDLDAGVLLPLSRKTSLGVIFQNLLPANLGAKILWPDGNSESIPMVVKAGLASRQLREDLLLALDCDVNVKRQYPSRAHAGVEWKPSGGLILRSGLDQMYDAGSVSSGLTMGLGLEVGSFIFDYAYHPYFSGMDDTTTHYFSFSYGLDRAPE